MSAMPMGLKKAAGFNALRCCQLFAGLPAADLEKVAEVSVIKFLAKGE